MNFLKKLFFCIFIITITHTILPDSTINEPTQTQRAIYALMIYMQKKYPYPHVYFWNLIPILEELKTKLLKIVKNDPEYQTLKKIIDDFNPKNIFTIKAKIKILLTYLPEESAQLVQQELDKYQIKL